MKRICTILLITSCTIAGAEDWPGWRGPRGDGSSAETNVPTRWDGPSDRNVRWKTAIRGSGYSSPIVSGDAIFVTACDEKNRQRLLHCLNRDDGTVRWSRSVIEAPLEGMHKLNSYASGTPVTDGEHVFVSFFRTSDNSGQRGKPGEMVVASFDYNGDQDWLVNAGAFSSIHGFCTSPVLYHNLLLVNGDHDGESYLAALNKQTGEVVWRTPRIHRTRSYVTPLVREIDGKPRAVMAGSKCVAGFDPETGERLWWVNGPTEQFVASMVYDEKRFYLTAGFPTHHVMAIRPGGKHNVTRSHVAWHVNDAKSYVPSPVVTGGLLFVADDRGIGHCFDASTGRHLWRQRLGRHFSASLITASGLVYFTADDGVTTVIRADREPKIIETNELGEWVYASPAVSEGKLYLRSTEHLLCIGSE